MTKEVRAPADIERRQRDDASPARNIDAWHALPCIRSGFCCKSAPCLFGEPIPGGRACRYLEVERELAPGVPIHRCGRYEWIMANVDGPEYYPAFGAGCSSTLFNTDRERILAVLGA